jgi:adenylate cyclase
MPVHRKLAAVVMADVVGYSRLMERDEAGTHERLRKLHDVHEDLGIEFIDAGEQHVKNISKPVRVFRVVLGKGGAARARAWSNADRALHGRLGRRAFGAVAALVVLALAALALWQWQQRTAFPTMAHSGPPPRSIMVLPFRAASGDAAVTAIAEALGADTARALANSVRDARILAPNAAALAKNVSTDERALGRDANVRYLVGGEVRAAGDDIVVDVRLADTATGKEAASERRSIARSRAAEDRELLVARVTAASRVMFQNAEGRRMAAEPPGAADAQTLVARANAVFTGEDLASTRAARKLFEQAREKDPTLMAAWIGHFYTLDEEYWNDLAAGRNEKVLAEMDYDSRRAIALDDRDPQAWFARAGALIDQRQWQAAAEAFARVQALDPSRFMQQNVGLLVMTGRSADALKAIANREAMAGVPDPSLLFMKCHAHIHLGQYAEGLAACERAVAADNGWWLYLDLTVAYAQTDDMARAASAKTQLLKAAPDFTIARLEAKQFSNNPVWIDEIRTRFIPGLRKAGVPE